MNAALSHKFLMHCLTQAKYENSSEFQKNSKRNRAQRQTDLGLVRKCYREKINISHKFCSHIRIHVVSEIRFNPLRSAIENSL